MKYANQTHQVLLIAGSPVLTWGHFEERKKMKVNIGVTKTVKNWASHVSHKYFFFSLRWVKLEMTLIQVLDLDFELVPVLGYKKRR